MPDEEIYKITFDLDGGVASELNSLNNRLSQIQARTKVLDRGFKDKAEQSALVGAFAGGMQMERNKKNATIIENRILKRVVINNNDQKQSKNNVISYESFLKVSQQLKEAQIIMDKMKPFARLGQNQYPKALARIQNQESVISSLQSNILQLREANKGWKRLVKLKDMHIDKLNQALDRVYNRMFWRSGGQYGAEKRIRPEKINQVGNDLMAEFDKFILYKERIG